jgi:hypothetical protein
MHVLQCNQLAGKNCFLRLLFFGGEEEGGGVRSGPGAARTILLFHTISARPPKQPRMVRTFLTVHTLPRLAGHHHLMHCGVEVTESSTNKQHHISHEALPRSPTVWTTLSYASARNWRAGCEQID